MYVRILALAACMALTACASQPDTFYRPNTSTEQFNRDYAACKLYAMQMPDRGTDVADELRPQSPIGAFLNGYKNAERPKEAARLCMQAKGYALGASQ